MSRLQPVRLQLLESMTANELDQSIDSLVLPPFALTRLHELSVSVSVDSSAIDQLAISCARTVRLLPALGAVAVTISLALGAPGLFIDSERAIHAVSRGIGAERLASLSLSAYHRSGSYSPLPAELSDDDATSRLLSSLANLTGLTALRLPRLLYLSPEALTRILASLPNLRSLAGGRIATTHQWHEAYSTSTTTRDVSTVIGTQESDLLLEPLVFCNLKLAELSLVTTFEAILRPIVRAAPGLCTLTLTDSVIGQPLLSVAELDPCTSRSPFVAKRRIWDLIGQLHTLTSLSLNYMSMDSADVIALLCFGPVSVSRHAALRLLFFVLSASDVGLCGLS
jgi:hypothetical protein